MKAPNPFNAKKIAPFVWEVAPDAKPGMRVPARILASDALFSGLDQGVFDQVTNVACMPGIAGHALCMPDGHWGYGFPVGGVAAFDLDEGVISPGGIGFDINCGMRLLRTDLTFGEIRPKLAKLMDELYRLVPCGVGSKGVLRLTEAEFRDMTTMGAAWAVKHGYGRPEDLECIEAGGCIPSANPEHVSDKAVNRGRNQLGTLGSGNHYLEVQVVKPENVFDPVVAEKLGIDRPGQICIMVHCGSRGFGHQVATDYLRLFVGAMKEYGISLPDKQLACAPFGSTEGEQYFAAMNCAANSAFANRQLISHRIGEAFANVLGKNLDDIGLRVVYDVAHNIAKVEDYEIAGQKQPLLVHRKGATRSFGPGDPEVPARYRETGQPVIVGGSMETGSYLLVGTDVAMTESFGSTLHGAGRTMSRTKAKKLVRGAQLRKSMLDRGIQIRTASLSGLAEEAGLAYKDIAEVVETVHELGISRRVARLIPVGNVKG